MNNMDTCTVNGVYYLESQNQGMNLIAIRPSMSPYHYISWEDTGHGRSIKFTSVSFDNEKMQLPCPLKSIPNKIDVIAETGNYRFVKLTQKIFNEKVKPFVTGSGSLNFKTDDEAQEYYLTTDFGG